LSVDKNEWKRDNDEPDAPLLLHGDEAAEEADVVIRGEQRNESNHKASDSLKHGWRVDREPTRLDLRQWRGHQFTSPNQKPPIIVRAYQQRHGSRQAHGQGLTRSNTTATRRPPGKSASIQSKADAQKPAQLQHERAEARPRCARRPMAEPSPVPHSPSTRRPTAPKQQNATEGSTEACASTATASARPPDQTDRRQDLPIHAPAPLHADQGAGPPYPHTRRPAPLSRLSTPPTGTGRAPRPHPRRHKPC
jgi:hypothetical protein